MRTGIYRLCVQLKIVSEYDQEIPQSQTADTPVAPRERAAQPSPKPELYAQRAVSCVCVPTVFKKTI